MPNPRVVSVSLSVTTTANQEGYTQAKDPAGNNINYYYKFAGGDGGNGNISGTSHGTDIDVTVSLDSGSNGAYDIKQGEFKSGSSPTDILFSAPDASGNSVQFVDHELNVETVGYSIVVNPRGANTPDIVCDPSIRNQWGGGG